MRKLICIVCTLGLILGGCYKDDIDNLKKRVDKLEESMEDYRVLLNALQNNSTVKAINSIEGGYEILFSDGSMLKVFEGTTAVLTKGENGNWYINGTDTGIEAGQEMPELSPGASGNWTINGMETEIPAAPGQIEGIYIVSVIDQNGVLTFYMSDGSVVTVKKMRTSGFYILSEGTWGQGDSELAFYDVNSGALKTKYYNEINGTALGETGNDLKIYGSKMYCAVSGEGVDSEDGYIQVINPFSGEAIKRIIIKDNAQKQMMPRKLSLYNGKVYVSLYSGAVAAIDTNTLEVTSFTTLSGTFSEGICAYENKLYICNSGQGSGNTISVVDIPSFTEQNTIVVAANPNAIAVASSTGDIYFTTLGDYSNVPANVHVLTPAKDTVAKTFDFPAAELAVGKDYVYTSHFDWNGFESTVNRIDIMNYEVSDFSDNLSSSAWPKSITVDPNNGDVYIGQVMGGFAYVLNEDGTEKTKLNSRVINVNSIAFINY